MAPDADLVLCLFFPSDSDTDYDPSLSSSWYLLNSLAYLQGYVRNSQQRAVISMSLNAHSGPHNGKGDVVDALAGLQQLMKGCTGIRKIPLTAWTMMFTSLCKVCVLRANPLSVAFI